MQFHPLTVQARADTPLGPVRLAASPTSGASLARREAIGFHVPRCSKTLTGPDSTDDVGPAAFVAAPASRRQPDPTRQATLLDFAISGLFCYIR